MKKVAGTKTFLCEICGKVSSSYQVHYGHKQIHRTDKVYTCLICEKTFNTCSKLCRHRKIHVKVKKENPDRPFRDPAECPHKCGSCDKAFRNLDALKAHELNIHTSFSETTALIPCHLCSRSFSHPFLLQRHLKASHTKEPHVRCHLCPNVYRRKRSLNYHLRTFHKVDTKEPQKYPCTLCDKQFSCKDGLTRHLKLHNNEKPFKCATCGKSFAQSGNLKAHENIHKNLKPYVCNRCGKGFNQTSNLNTHKKKNSC